MKRIEPPPMTLTPKQLEAVRKINKDNAEFWATPEANLTHRVLAAEQSKVAVRAGQDHKRSTKGAAGKRAIGQNSAKRVHDAAVELFKKKPTISKQRAAEEIARKVSLSERQTYRLLPKRK